MNESFLNFFCPFVSEIDDCLSRPCQNGGTCEDQLGKYVCHCDVATTDKDCYIPGV